MSDRSEICWSCWIRLTLLLKILHTNFAIAVFDASMIQCYSCMSKDLDVDFQRGLAKIYIPQSKFDDRCNDPFSSKGIPLVNCSTMCAILKEADTKMGILLGHVYIRGCLDKILVNGFNKSALHTHRFNFDDACRVLPWHQLMNQGNWRTGEVKMCTCFGSRCNESSSNQASNFLLITTLIILTIRVFR